MVTSAKMPTNKSSFGIITDQETKVDLLNNEAIAKTIVGLITETLDKPMTIGVHGDWGAGKSSILEMIKGAFEEENEIVCIKFNGWQFQGFEDAKIAVIEGIVTELIERRPILTKATEQVKNIFRSIDWLKAAKSAGGLAFTAFTGMPAPGQIKNIVEGVKSFIANPASASDAIENTELSNIDVTGLIKETASKNVPKEIKEFRKAFEDLIEKAKIKRLIVLIDDLDRCLPETTIETLEAIRLFVFLPQTVFIVGADEAMIEYSVKQHFPDLSNTGNSATYSRSYLEKLIQVPMRIPSLGETETRIYITLLLIGSVLGESSEEFDAILQLGKQALQKPWEGSGINEEEIKSVLKDRYTEVQPSMLLAEQITPILSAGTKGNPRQIKRFLNALNLRMRVSEERGFGNAINVSVLAKLMLAEMFLPQTVFEHIASSVANSEEGICIELVALEAAHSTDKNGNNETTQDNIILEDWKLQSEVTKWASIQPFFEKNSLKPYLFVIKDRKNYLGRSAPLSPKLNALIKKLIGGKTSAKSVNKDLKLLSSDEVEVLFKQLKIKFLENDSFTTKPIELIGIEELIQSQPSLQIQFVELFEGIQLDKIGFWFATGHEKIITDVTAKKKHETIKQKWLNLEQNKAMRSGLSTLIGGNQ